MSTSPAGSTGPRPARRRRRARPSEPGPARAATEERRARRAASVPALAYPPELPVSDRREEIMAAIAAHQVVVVAGETGSGKTTQIPKMCLELGRGVAGLIGHTQPRRIAARTVAERLAEEMGVAVGAQVGYSVRFDDVTDERTLVKVMTDGILLAEIRRDPELRAYDTIIVDEAHERSLNIDFLLGYLTQLLPRRPDLKVVITSATIDTARFAAHFGAPVVEVSGRTYPVEVRYRPLRAERDPDGDRRDHDTDADSGPGSPSGPARGTPGTRPDATGSGRRGDRAAAEERDPSQALCDAVAELTAAGPGDILVFLPGERDIRDAAEALRADGPEGIEVLPLYARLSAAEQHRVFRPHRGLRVVLATNVAETSLTVPGVRYVVDTGLARVSRFSHRSKVQRLPIERVSRASADQRAGRCGRVAPGTCIRLYSEEDYQARPEFTDPEILRTNLASVILQMAAIGLGRMEDFPFIEPPDRRAVADGRALLEELGAFDSGGRLTPLGRRLARLPLDPRLGRMVIEAQTFDCLREVTVIAAALSIQDPRERPLDDQAAADEMHRRFAVAGSDFLAVVKLWDHLAELRSELSGNQFRKRCRTEYLNVLRIREWQDVAGQIRQVLRAEGARANREPAPPEHVHRALLAGLLSQVGLRDPARGDYRGARNTRWTIARGSALARRPPAWAMAGELVETDRTRARSVAAVEPRWLEQAGAHLVKRTWSEPWWDPKRGEAMADERVTLFGLPVVTARPVSLARVDPAEARRLFIQRALVERDWPVELEPLTRTEERIAAVRALEERVRRRDLLAADEVVFAFYDRELPAGITGGSRFQRWWHRARRQRPDALAVPMSVLVDASAGAVDLRSYPDRWHQGELDLPLRYRFDPGSDDDGVTVVVPLVALNRLRPDGFDWGIPGHRRELVTALVRSLPKALRRSLAPAAAVADSVLASAGPDDGPLLDVVAARLAAISGEPVSPGLWDPGMLPAHLSTAFEVVDSERRLVRRGKDLLRLQQELRHQVRAAIAAAVPGVERHGATAWEFGSLPRRMVSGDAIAFPALVDEGDSVGLRLFESESEQAAHMWLGARRLLMLAAPPPLAHLQRRLTNETKLALARSGQSFEALVEDCTAAVLDRLVVAHGGPPWDERAFDRLSAEARSVAADQTARLATIAGGVLAAAEAVDEQADRLSRRAPDGRLDEALADVRLQVEGLTAPGFVSAAGPSRLGDVLRYLRAAGARLDRLGSDTARDATRMAVVRRVSERYWRLMDRAATGQAAPGVLAGAAEVRWMIEELRVSLWAQSLGTPAPVSEARIMRALDRLGAERVGS